METWLWQGVCRDVINYHRAFGFGLIRHFRAGPRVNQRCSFAVQIETSSDRLGYVEVGEVRHLHARIPTGRNISNVLELVARIPTHWSW